MIKIPLAPYCTARRPRPLRVAFRAAEPIWAPVPPNPAPVSPAPVAPTLSELLRQKEQVWQEAQQAIRQSITITQTSRLVCAQSRTLRHQMTIYTEEGFGLSDRVR